MGLLIIERLTIKRQEGKNVKASLAHPVLWNEKGQQKAAHSVEHRKRSGCTPAWPYPQADNDSMSYKDLMNTKSIG